LFPSVKLLLGVAKGFLSSVKLLSAGADRAGKEISTEGNEENEDSILAFNKPLCCLRFLLLIGNQVTSKKDFYGN
jgi:hypothetical protein